MAVFDREGTSGEEPSEEEPSQELADTPAGKQGQVEPLAESQAEP